MVPGWSSALRILRDSCFAGFIWACFFHRSSGHAVLRVEYSDLFDAATLREEDDASLMQEDILQKAAPLEEDAASLLQVVLNRENQSDEVNGKVGAAHDHASKRQHDQGKKSKRHTRNEGDLLLMMKESGVSGHAGVLMMRAGDQEVAILGLVFIFVALLVGLCASVVFAPTGGEESQRFPDKKQEEQHVVQKASASSIMEPRGSSGSSRAFRGRQAYQRPASASPTQTKAKTYQRSAGPNQTKANTSNTSMSLNSSGDLASSSMPGLPLCPSLLVPEGTRLACVVRADVSRQKQTLSFSVRSVSQRGGSPIFRVDVQEIPEISGGKQGIFLKTLDGVETLASLSTEELWNNEQHQPALSIYRASGVLFGTVQKNSTGGYTVMRGATSLLTVCGDFHAHSAQVITSQGRTIASSTSLNSSEYQVNVQSRVDTGLVLLALLAAQKLEPGYSDI